MALSSELLSQFAKVTKNQTPVKKEATVQGTVVEHNGRTYVKIDGSDRLTPVSTTTDAKADERVTVLIKDHTATVTGNLSSPSARTDDVKEQGEKISELDVVMAYKITTEDLAAVNASITNLIAKTGSFTELSAITAEIENLKVKYSEIDRISAKDAEILNAEIENLKTKIIETKILSAEELEAVNADINNLKSYNASFTYVSADRLTAIKGEFNSLEAKVVDAETGNFKFANIDFSNIGEAAIEKLFSDSGIIKDLVVSGGHITGELVGVTIKGDLIETGTLKADKLVVLGSDGIYYKLNVDALGETTVSGMTSEEHAKLQNGLHGDVLVAKSVTAEKVLVDDLVAFGATIGGFNITDNSIYSGVKSSPTNTTKGIYLDNEGQIAFGDGTNYIRYYKNSDGKYLLEVTANAIKFGTSGKSIEDELTSVNDKASNAQTSANNAQTSADNAQNTANSALNTANKNATDLSNFVDSVTKDVLDLQAQIDGNITTWFYNYEPTISNVPASNWTSTEIKNQHLGDLFYIIDNAEKEGQVYRWAIIGSEYKWIIVEDAEVTKALADASKAQYTADSKRRVFVNEPTPPYDIGDLWVQGSGGEIMVCSTSRLTGSYLPSDWKKSNKYTDDTSLNELNIFGRNYISYGKGDVKKGFFSNFDIVEDGYGEKRLVSKGTYSNISLVDGYILGCREYEVGKQVTFSFDVMFTEWNFPEGTNRNEWSIGQRYAGGTSESSQGAWVDVTKINMPSVGTDGCELEKWFHVSKTMTIPEQAHPSIGTYANIQLYNSNSGIEASVTFRMKNVKLEYGTKETGFTTAVEDIDKTIDDTFTNLQQIIDETADKTLDSAEEKIDSALSVYVPEEEYTRYKEKTTSDLNILDGKINMNFTTTKKRIDGVDADFQDKYSEIKKYIRFSKDGIELGSNDNPIKLSIDNGMIKFMNDSKKTEYNPHGVIGWWDGDDFYTGNIVVETNRRAQFGNFAFVPRSDGSLMFLKVNDAANLFNISYCGFESNVVSYATIGSTGAEVIVSSADLSAVYFKLNPEKSYNVSYSSENCDFTAFDSNRNVKGRGTGDGDKTLTISVGGSQCYFFMRETNETMTYSFSNVMITEV